MIKGHGNNLYHYAKGLIKIDFSSNIAFNNQSDKIIEFLQDHLSSIKNYPDPSATVLTSKIAAHHGVKPEELLVVNGSAEAFYIVAHFLATHLIGTSDCRTTDCRTLIYTPAFAEYEDSCKLYKHDLHFEHIYHFTNSDLSQCDSLWIGNPNNPNGYSIKSKEIVEKCQQYPNCYFVVDKAYNELSDASEFESEIPENLILINSLTKSFGIPGIRLGYIIASEFVIKTLESMRPPWSVNTMSLLAGEYIMDNYADLQPNREELVAESKFMQYKINDIDGFNVVASTCNFFLCEISDKYNVEELQSYLINNHGILIRDASNFRGLSNKYFRVAAQSRADNEQLIKALKEWK